MVIMNLGGESHAQLREESPPLRGGEFRLDFPCGRVLEEPVCVTEREQGETQSRRGKVGEEGGKEKGMEHRRIIYRKRPAPSWTRRP